MSEIAPPPWADRVPRWQQMDGVARAVADAWYARFGLDPDAAPGELVLALPAASNDADVEFAKSGAFSPQRFVATLPSVAAAPVLQLTGRVLPVTCVQRGAETLAVAREEARLIAGARRVKVGLLHVPRDLAVVYEEYQP